MTQTFPNVLVGRHTICARFLADVFIGVSVEHVMHIYKLIVHACMTSWCRYCCVLNYSSYN